MYVQKGIICCYNMNNVLLLNGKNYRIGGMVNETKSGGLAHALGDSSNEHGCGGWMWSEDRRHR